MKSTPNHSCTQDWLEMDVIPVLRTRVRQA